MSLSSVISRGLSNLDLNFGGLREEARGAPTRGSFGAVRLAAARPVSFAEHRLFNRALLQKRPIILSILLTEATP